MKERPTVMVAGIGGASLGTEILKSLALSGRYRIFGCDISRLAYGHYQDNVERSFVVERQEYAASVLDVCRQAGVNAIVPGGEEPLALLNDAAEQFAQAGIHLAANAPEIIERFSDKEATFKILAELGFDVPLTVTCECAEDLGPMTYPCIVKPATGSGGSSFVFLAESREEAALYVRYLIANGKKAILQEYIPDTEGEFTIGVLSLPGGRIAGSVALKRIFDSKLSVLAKNKVGLVSSGYSQGLIDDFPGLRADAERIAAAIGSSGPINIQGRAKDGRLLPFEINPRFSASTYLRALAGFNELDIYLQYVINGISSEPAPLRPGYYLRSFSEVFVSKDNLVS